MHAEPQAQLCWYLFEILHAPVLVSSEARNKDLVVIAQENCAKRRHVPRMSKQSAPSCGIGVAECYRGTCGYVFDVRRCTSSSVSSQQSLLLCRQTATEGVSSGVLQTVLKHIFFLKRRSAVGVGEVDHTLNDGDFRSLDPVLSIVVPEAAARSVVQNIFGSERMPSVASCVKEGLSTLRTECDALAIERIVTSRCRDPTAPTRRHPLQTAAFDKNRGRAMRERI